MAWYAIVHVESQELRTCDAGHSHGNAHERRRPLMDEELSRMGDCTSSLNVAKAGVSGTILECRSHPGAVISFLIMPIWLGMFVRPSWMYHTEDQAYLILLGDCLPHRRHLPSSVHACVMVSAV